MLAPGVVDQAQRGHLTAGAEHRFGGLQNRGIASAGRSIWEYDATTLAWDLSAHLAYGAGTGTTFWLLTRVG
jgi:hypothetical protein